MRLSVKVKPKSKKDELIIEPDGAIKVRIKATPIDGRANEYLIVFLAEYFGLAKSSITILKGGNSQFKLIELAGDETEIKKKIRKI